MLALLWAFPAAHAQDSVGDGIPDQWRAQYFGGDGTTTNADSCAACTSANPRAHGLTNLQVYQNPGVLKGDNYSTVGDGIPDWWKAAYGLSLTNPHLAKEDPTGDGYSILEDYLNGLNPNVSNVPAAFVVNERRPYSQSLTVSIQAKSTVYPNILVSLDPAMRDAVLLANPGGQIEYTLPDHGDGGYMLWLKYADAQGQPRSTRAVQSVTVDRTPPVVYITSPASTAVLNQAFITLEATAADPNPIKPDGFRRLSIWINGQRYWDRAGTSIVIKRFPVPAGANSFTVTILAVDEAGNTNQATQTWTVDTSTATTAPKFLSVNLSPTMSLPDVRSIWVEGNVDNPNALISAIVRFPSGAITTNSLNMRNSHYEGSVPLERGVNHMKLVASDAAGNMSSNLFTLICSNRFRCQITSPAFGAFATSPTTHVSGYVSALYDEGLPTQTTITGVFINGVAAVLGTNIDANGNRSFTTTNAIGLGVPITGYIAGPGITDEPASEPADRVAGGRGHRQNAEH